MSRSTRCAGEPRGAAPGSWTKGHGWGTGPRRSHRMCAKFLERFVGGALAQVVAGGCCLKLKIPPELENFDAEAFQQGFDQAAGAIPEEPHQLVLNPSNVQFAS